MKSPKILLIRIGGVYNYGCEAIVRGTEIIIRREYPDADIVYASLRAADDIKRLKGSRVQVTERSQRKLRRYSVRNIFRKLISMVGFKWDPMVESLDTLTGVNAVLSIGGDIYTLRPNGDYCMSFPKFGDAVERRGIPYVLWGASVGPFTENPRIEKAFIRHLKGLSLITAREAATIGYLKTIGISENVVPCADPAYVVAPEIKASDSVQEGRFTIGINVSPLSVCFLNQSVEEIINEQARTISRLAEMFDAHIMLIPHVICNFSEGDDDLRYLQKIRRAIAPEYQKSVELLKGDLGFVGTKKKLVTCDLVIAARMHCAINALAAHVPTILLAYSRKAEGMCQYVYGNGDWVLPLSEFTKEGVLTEKVRSMKDRASEIRNYLSRRIPEIQEDSYRPMQKLKKILGDV